MNGLYVDIEAHCAAVPVNNMIRVNGEAVYRIIQQRMAANTSEAVIAAQTLASIHRQNMLSECSTDQIDPTDADWIPDMGSKWNSRRGQCLSIEV